MQYQPFMRIPGSWLLAIALVLGWHYRYLCPSQQPHVALIYRQKTLKRRPEAIHAVFLLFPTLSNIASTPNGRLLAVGFIFRSSKIVAEETKAYFLSAGQTSPLLFIWPGQISTRKLFGIFLFSLAKAAIRCPPRIYFLATKCPRFIEYGP